ncbi:MAG: hypothetical protein ACE5EB_09215 [Thermodesulfobacteriota bacterium]
MAGFKEKYLHGLIVFVCVFGLWGGAVRGAHAGGAGGLKWGADFDLGLAYNSNVYKLSAAQKARRDANSTASQTSGRFTDMESTDDFIASPEVEFSLKVDGLGGRDLEIKPGVTYNIYAQNQEKNFLELALEIKQDVTKYGVFSVEVGYEPDVFKKNYLSDAIDTSGDGLITDDERVYSKGNYDKKSIVASYKHRLWKGPKGIAGSSELEKVYGKVFAGYEKKDYDSPFDATRTTDNFLAGTGIDMEFGGGAELSFKYTFENITADAAAEVLILNEADFGVDFNGINGIESFDARTVQNVDRSHNDHKLKVKGRLKVAPDWYAEAGYELRFQFYKSEERFDVTRVDRTDVRHRVGAGIEGELAKDWSLGVGWDWTHEEAGRDGLAAINQADTKSYDRHVVSAVISYSL